MKSTPELLAAVKRKHGLTSDYQLGGRLGIDRAKISAYVNGHRKLTDGDALKVAAALELAPAAVLAAVALERTTDEEARKAWTAAIKRLGGLAAGVLMMLGGGPTPPAAGAAGRVVQCGEIPVYYVKRRRGAKRRRAWVDALRRALAPAPSASFA